MVVERIVWFISDIHQSVVNPSNVQSLFIQILILQKIHRNQSLLSLQLGIWFELDLIKRFVYLWCSKKHKNLHFFNSLLSFCLFFTKFLVRYVIITIMIMIDRYSFEIWCSIDSCSSIYKKSSIIKREALAIISFEKILIIN